MAATSNNECNEWALSGIAGFFVGIIFLLLILIFTGGREYDGYCNAYEDMKKGKIEQVIKKRNPALWIKYNVSEEKSNDTSRK
jgi:hypothetical protein